jgi:hypothetical protein
VAKAYERKGTHHVEDVRLERKRGKVDDGVGNLLDRHDGLLDALTVCLERAGTDGADHGGLGITWQSRKVRNG